MANYCYFSMRVTGKKENIEEFYKVISSDYDYSTNKFSFPRHLWRIYEVNCTDIKPIKDYYYMDIWGECAWSVYCCMFEGEYTEYTERLQNGYTHGTSIIQETRNLNLAIEIYSDEEGEAFEEHYIVTCGHIICSEEIDTENYYFETPEEIEEFNKNHNTNLDADYILDECQGYYKVGGYDTFFKDLTGVILKEEN